jgi:uncharacterized membrane protein (UPF0127 family)
MVWLRASHSSSFKFSLTAKLVFLFGSLLFSTSAHSDSKIKFKTRAVTIGKKNLSVMIADTEAKREQGMMFKTTWPKNAKGMLFIFEDQNRRSFWMKNTLLPLSLGFFDSEGVLLETASMDPPKSLAQVKIDRVLSLKPAKYVLEVPKGWFKKEGVKAGSKLRLL